MQPLPWERKVSFPQGRGGVESGKGWNFVGWMLRALNGEAETGLQPNGSCGCGGQSPPAWVTAWASPGQVMLPEPFRDAQNVFLLSKGRRMNLHGSQFRRVTGRRSFPLALGGPRTCFSQGAKGLGPSQSSRPSQHGPLPGEGSLPGFPCPTLCSFCLHSLTLWYHQLSLRYTDLCFQVLETSV